MGIDKSEAAARGQLKDQKKHAELAQMHQLIEKYHSNLMAALRSEDAPVTKMTVLWREDGYLAILQRHTGVEYEVTFMHGDSIMEAVLGLNGPISAGRWRSDEWANEREHR